MKVSSKEDLDAPIEAVFEMLSEFDVFERAAMRRGVDLESPSSGSAPFVGQKWRADFTMRGKRRTVAISLTDYAPPQSMRFDADAQGLEGVFTVDLVALSPRRTRMAVALEARPKTLSARLMIQSVKLAKANLTKRFKLRVADYAKSLEDRHNSSVQGRSG